MIILKNILNYFVEFIWVLNLGEKGIVFFIRFVIGKIKKKKIIDIEFFRFKIYDIVIEN